MSGLEGPKDSCRKCDFKDFRTKNAGSEVVRCRILTKDSEHSAPQSHNNWWSLHCEFSDFLHHLEMRSVLVRFPVFTAKATLSRIDRTWMSSFRWSCSNRKNASSIEKRGIQNSVWRTHKNWDSRPPELQLLWPACLDKSSAADNFVDSSTRLDCSSPFHCLSSKYIFLHYLHYLHIFSFSCPQTLLRGERKGDDKPECKGCWGTCGDACFWRASAHFRMPPRLSFWSTGGFCFSFL